MALVKMRSDKFDLDFYVETDPKKYHDESELKGVPLFYPYEIEHMPKDDDDMMRSVIEAKIKFPGTYQVIDKESGETCQPKKPKGYRTKKKPTANKALSKLDEIRKMNLQKKNEAS